ncbi:type II toxin-antitoxin system RelE/ParE family toxin [Massilia sp. BJB1822]|uniref:type II toxin-antitoxin system RelE/ParE family toxin n=1 Tax=Massilia sp. BJB1822 TaxID=2744470 RepID=UPI0015939473|nr:type II toxin-antitoxin system RelE/ParE family toxin [Massilia sp. BJB1822]
MPLLPILWRPKALADLSTILEYIAQRNPQAAANLYGDIDRIVSQLPHHPYLYRLGRIAGTRELVAHPNYVIVYSVTTAAIEIVAIVHTRQRYP